MNHQSDLEKIDRIYQDYAKTTLPKGKGWFLFLSISLALLVLVPTVLHRVYKFPLFPNEIEIVKLISSLILLVFVAGVILGGRKKNGIAYSNDAIGKYALYQPVIRSLMVFPEVVLRQFLDLQKEDWAEADKEAETSAPVLIVLGTLITTLANWGSQPKAQFILVLFLIAAVYFAIAYSKKRLVQLRRFDYFIQQAMIQKKGIGTPESESVQK